jgi:hypothetical protein
MEKKPEPTFKVYTEQQVKDLTTQIPGMGTFYVNHARIAPGFYDVRLFMGQSSVSPTGEQIVQEHLSVILSPECAKMLADALAKSMNQFVNLFGALREPPKFATPLVEEPPTTRKIKTRK